MIKTYVLDLSHYVDKLIALSLSKNDTNLITEMSNIILKYNFALNRTTCRALVSTTIHIDEVLARQLYNYAEGMGIYSTVKVKIYDFIYKFIQEKKITQILIHKKIFLTHKVLLLFFLYLL